MSTAKIITVEIIEHRETGLLVGISEDMKGLYVHGRSREELEARLAPAIKELFEASGKPNVQVLSVEDHAPEVSPAFVSTRAFRKFAIAA